ncbi:MAG: hypothetical protein V5A55_07050 [Halovenus sp.]
MTGSSTLRRKGDPKGGGRDAIEAFELLSNQTRLAILLALWESVEANDERHGVPFSELADRIDYDSPGNFNYHLKKLTGRYVRKTDRGYLPTEAGGNVIRAIRAGAITRDVSLGPFEIDDLCPYCDGVVEVRYEDTHIVARCTECDGPFLETSCGESRLVVSHRELPPAGVQNRGPTAAVDAYLTRVGHLGFSMLAGTCPECASKPRVSTLVCPDHNSGARGCETCGQPYHSWTEMVCTHCKFGMGVPTRWLPIRNPRVGSFFQERGVDVTRGFSLELWSVLDEADEHVRSTDPLELVITYRIEGERLSVRVEDVVTVVDISE